MFFEGLGFSFSEVVEGSSGPKSFSDSVSKVLIFRVRV